MVAPPSVRGKLEGRLHCLHLLSGAHPFHRLRDFPLLYLQLLLHFRSPRAAHFRSVHLMMWTLYLNTAVGHTGPQKSSSSLLSFSMLFITTLSPSALLSGPCCVAYLYGEDHALHVAKSQVLIPVLILMLSECVTVLLPRATPSITRPSAIPTSVHPPSATVLSICSSFQYPSTFCQVHFKKINLIF